MPSRSQKVQVVRVFVSSPGDVEDARSLMREVVDSINDTDGKWRGFRLELFRWEKDVVPQVGPKPQRVVDLQTPVYDIYLGIMSTRFGRKTDRYGSGTEKEFREALKNWKKAGSPWIMFYFDAQPKLTGDPEQAKQFLQVCTFRSELEKKGIVATYTDLRGSADGFYEKVSTHFRKVLQSIPQAKKRQPASERKRAKQPEPTKPVVPPEYLEWLFSRCKEVELMGLQAKSGSAVRLNHVYVPLVTSAGPQHEVGPVRQRGSEVALERQSTPTLLMDLLNENSLYVSGDPGAGKSTFCRWVTWLACNKAMPPADVPAPESYQERFPEHLHGRLPLLVRLRDFWPHLPPSSVASVGFAGLERSLEQWLADQRMPGLKWACLKSHLDAGLTLLMLDGVDEVPSIRSSSQGTWYPREMLLNVLPEAVDRWTMAGNRVLITSRPYGVESHQQLRLGIGHAPIQVLDQDLQALLIRRWFVHLDESRERGLEKASAMVDHLQREHNLDELAANPLLLTAMCIIYDEGKRLPEDKYELYDRIVDTVLYKRYESRERLETIRGRLRAIAFGMHTGEGLGQERESPEATASGHEIDLLLEAYGRLDGSTDKGLGQIVQVREDLLSQSGLLVPREDGRAFFYHLSFQEFLAAERLFVLVGRERDGLTDALGHRGLTAGWRNTLSFVFGCLIRKFNPHAGVDLLQSLIEQIRLPEGKESGREQAGAVWNQVIVLGDCLEILSGSGAAVPMELKGFFQRAVMQAIDREIPVRERQTLAAALGILGDPRIAPDLRVRAHPDDHPGYVKIPEGSYYYGKDKVPFVVSAPFWLSRYPVTNSQYALFLEDGGYQKREFWSKEGWRWLEEEQVKAPEYWRHPALSAPNQPVVGVSFWEAEAFARWTGGSLPTERQWEAAARGPEGYTYPWGDTWEDGICNSDEASLGRTSSVGIFPRSRSRPFELEDMAGNVLDWCMDKVASYRVIRGGCWFFDAGHCRSADRNGDEPGDRYYDLGFRVAQFPPGKRAE